MSITIGDRPEQNVVNVGDELTADQLAALQNAQGASATNPVLTRTNTFNTADTAVRITQEGAGAAFVVEDSANPDSTPFKIENDGRVGILGNTITGYGLTVNGNISVSQIAATNIFSHSISCTVPVSTSQIAGTFTNNSGSTVECVRITNLGTGNSFVVEDSTNPDASPFVIASDGKVGIGVASPTAHLEVNSGVITRKNLICNHSSSAYVVNNIEFNEAGSGVNLLVSSASTATGDTLRITNEGTGNSFVVEDSANPDASPFIINADGNIGIGRQPTSRKLEMTGNFAVTGQATLEATGSVDTLVITNSGTGNCINSTGRNYFVNTSGSGGNPVVWIRQQSTGGSAAALTVTNQGTGNSFVVEDDTNDTSPFVIDNAGNVTLGGSLTLASGSFSSSTAITINNTNYPHEILVKVGATTYAIPARAI